MSDSEPADALYDPVAALNGHPNAVVRVFTQGLDYFPSTAGRYTLPKPVSKLRPTITGS